jgi:hypothetical protein
MRSFIISELRQIFYHTKEDEICGTYKLDYIALNDELERI